MRDIEEWFFDELYMEEICESKKHGCTLTSIGPGLGSGISKKEIITKSNKVNIDLFRSLVDLYVQVEDIGFNWKVSENSSAGRSDTSIQFKEDTFLREHYLDADHSWEALKILISGHMQIATLDDILDIDKVKACGLYVAAEKVGLEAGSLRPLDFNEFAISCLKVEDGKLLDNVYVYAGFGEYEPALYDMGIGLEKYLELAYKAKCFNYWNLIYCMKEKVHLHALMKHTWPMLFPQLTPDLEEFGISY